MLFITIYATDDEAKRDFAALKADGSVMATLAMISVQPIYSTEGTDTAFAAAKAHALKGARFVVLLVRFSLSNSTCSFLLKEPSYTMPRACEAPV